MSDQDQSVHNPLPEEVVYTQEGHVLPGHTTQTAPEGDPVTQRLLESGRIIRPARKPAPPVTPKPAAPKPSSKKATTQTTETPTPVSEDSKKEGTTNE